MGNITECAVWPLESKDHFQRIQTTTSGPVLKFTLIAGDRRSVVFVSILGVVVCHYKHNRGVIR